MDTNRAGRRKPGPIAHAHRELVRRLSGMSTGDMKRLQTSRVGWQTMYRIGTGRTENPKVKVLEEIERILGAE